MAVQVKKFVTLSNRNGVHVRRAKNSDGSNQILLTAKNLEITIDSISDDGIYTLLNEVQHGIVSIDYSDFELPSSDG